MEKIRGRYYQVPHLTQDSTWESDKHTIRHHKREPRGHHFPAGDQRASVSRRAQKHKNTRQNNTIDPQKKNRFGTASKNILLERLSPLHGANLASVQRAPENTHNC